MPTLTFIIIFGSILLVAAVAVAVTWRKRHEIDEFGFYTTVSLLLIFALLSAFILAGVQRVEKDTIRILDREGEPFKVLTSGTHYTAEFDSYGESNLDCSPQISEAAESVTLDSGRKFLVTADLTWQLVCTPDSALFAWRYLDDTSEGVDLERQLFNRYISQKVLSAIEACSPSGLIANEILPWGFEENALKEYYALRGSNCAAANTQTQSTIIRVLGFSNWDVAYSSLPVGVPYKFR